MNSFQMPKMPNLGAYAQLAGLGPGSTHLAYCAKCGSPLNNTDAGEMSREMHEECFNQHFKDLETKADTDKTEEAKWNDGFDFNAYYRTHGGKPDA